MGLVNFLKRIFYENDISETEEIVEIPEENKEADELQENQEDEIIESENTIFNKLNYLEQYIKVFSLTFPEDYNGYLSVIQMLKSDYANELEKFEKGKEGSITFSIDPEYESKRYIEVITLEDDIKKFVEFEVDYKSYLDKFSKLCYKLNLFYNTIIETTVQKEKIISQIDNAYNSLETLVKEVRERDFFNKDSRKKDYILNYIIYCDYIIFKSALRVGIINDFEEYKQEISKIYSFFLKQQYDNLIFKFFIESIEELQILIKSNLHLDNMFDYVLKETQNLERNLEEYNQSFNNYTFFENVLKLENTVNGLIKLHKINFTFDLSKMISYDESKKEIISVNIIAKSILNLVNNNKAKLLEKVISRFTTQISWREFYFMCKIFELTSDIVKISDSTVFSVIKEKFLKLTDKYNEYTDDYISDKKNKILNYNGSKSKKYNFLITISEKEMVDIVDTLSELSLDFVVRENIVYLNYLYFNGFKNLEANFGEEIIF